MHHNRHFLVVSAQDRIDDRLNNRRLLIVREQLPAVLQERIDPARYVGDVQTVRALEQHVQREAECLLSVCLRRVDYRLRDRQRAVRTVTVRHLHRRVSGQRPAHRQGLAQLARLIARAGNVSFISGFRDRIAGAVAEVLEHDAIAVPQLQRCLKRKLRGRCSFRRAHDRCHQRCNNLFRITLFISAIDQEAQEL